MAHCVPPPYGQYLYGNNTASKRGFPYLLTWWQPAQLRLKSRLRCRPSSTSLLLGPPLTAIRAAIDPQLGLFFLLLLPQHSLPTHRAHHGLLPRPDLPLWPTGCEAPTATLDFCQNLPQLLNFWSSIFHGYLALPTFVCSVSKLSTSHVRSLNILVTSVISNF